MPAERPGPTIMKEISVLPEPDINGYMITAKISVDEGVTLGIEVSNTLKNLDNEQIVRKRLNGIPARIVGYEVSDTGRIDWVVNIYSEDVNNPSTSLDNTSW